MHYLFTHSDLVIIITAMLLHAHVFWPHCVRFHFRSIGDGQWSCWGALQHFCIAGRVWHRVILCPCLCMQLELTSDLFASEPLVLTQLGWAAFNPAATCLYWIYKIFTGLICYMLLLNVANLRCHSFLAFCQPCLFSRCLQLKSNNASVCGFQTPQTYNVIVCIWV